MRIILANKFYYPKGGDCVHTIGLKKLLENYGHNVAVFSMQHPENIENEYSRFWPSEVDYTNSGNTGFIKAMVRPINSKEVKTKWNALIEEFKPDLVHLNNIHTQLSPIIAKEAYKKGIPVYWTLHDFKLICPAYSMLREGKPCEECLQNKTNVIRHRCIKNSLAGSTLAYLEALVWTKNKLEKYTAQFIAPSEFLKTKMIQAGFSEKKISQVYNFAEDSKFIPSDKKEEYYVYLGRLSDEKGVRTLLQAAAEMPDFHLKIIGNGPLFKELTKKYKQSHIEFLGFQPWEKIKPLLEGARFLVLPSECYENNPLSIIESFALGTPVLGAEIGGIPELIKTGENGMLFTPGNKQSLKQMTQKMMKNKSWKFREISDNAKQKFNTTRYYKQLDKLYGIKN